MDHDFDEDDFGPRRRRYQDDDWDYHRPPERSMGVMFLVVANFVVGAFQVVIAMFCLFGAFLIMTHNRGPGRDEAMIPFSIGAVALLLGSGIIASGIGLLVRRQWGRIACLILSVFNFLTAAAGIFGMVQIVHKANRMQEGELIGLLLLGLGVLILVGHGILAYVTLLRSSVAAEFR